MKLGMGVVRKALFIATFGLSGFVLKDNSKKQRAAQPAAKRARPAQAKAARTQKAQSARRSKPKSARTGARAKASANGTAGELEMLAKLHNERALTDVEFAAGKAKILGISQPPREPGEQPARIVPPYHAVEANVTAARQLDGLAGRERPAVARLNSD
jgi:hypothetical protein